MARLSKTGYGQVELNNVAFRRDGRIEAQCALDTAAFGSNDVCENGMILRVNKAAHKIGFCDASAANQLYALNYSSEHMYDERKPGLKNFKLVSAAAGEDFLPRVGYLAYGDLWTTNTVDLGSYASAGAVEAALASNIAVYAAAGTDGYATLASAAPASGLVMQGIKKTTMPDGQDAFQLQVLKV
jgi:hypothetical protein